MSQAAALLLEDHHVHSVFSDGKTTIEENIVAAERLGLQRLGCVDHVRADTTYVPDYVAAIRRLRTTTTVVLTAGIEAKILDTAGQLDVPLDGTDGVDYVYAADHQFPWHDGPRSPREVKTWLQDGRVTAAQCVAVLIRSTVAAMHGYRRHPLVLAHLFSILPKVGLSEDDVADELLGNVGAVAVTTGTIVEVSERWRCPSARVLRALAAAGATVVCSTDSHSAATIGLYEYVRTVLPGITT